MEEGVLHCPFREFHVCPDREEGGKGISRMVSHIRRLHLCSDERKRVLREKIESDLGVFLALEETLRELGQWICGKCMSIHALSRACHHPDGLVRATDETRGVQSPIVGIMKPSMIGPEAAVAREGVVFDAELLDRIFRAPIITVKSIPHSCRLAFSQALKAALHRVAAEPSSVASWVKLLLLPRCTLQVFMPKNRQDSRSGSRKSIQQQRILRSLATWGEADGIAKCNIPDFLNN